MGNWKPPTLPTNPLGLGTLDGTYTRRKAGNGKHFGDISVTIGLDITYKPWALTMDVGSALSQALLERAIHKGVGQNWLLSVDKRF